MQKTFIVVQGVKLLAIEIFLQSYWVVSVIYGLLPNNNLTDDSFSSVSDRFIEFLEKYKNGVIPKDSEGTVETVIRGMTYLKIKVSSLVILH